MLIQVNNCEYWIEMCIFNSIEEDTDAYSDWLSNKKLRPYIILNKKNNSAARRNSDMAHESESSTS
ncbi:hypothetical protein IRB23SM22_18920 [Alkalibacterium sp. s-m-22]